MEFQNLWNTLLAGGIAACGWVARTIYAAVKALETDLANHKVEVAKTYATNNDMTRIEDKLDRILDKLDRKADK